jgi:hypothetical protein
VLHEVDEKHNGQCVRCAPVARDSIVGLNDFEQHLLRYDGVHLSEEFLALGDFLLGSVFGLAETDLLHDLAFLLSIMYQLRFVGLVQRLPKVFFLSC